ncbi:MAG TPA: pseudouridine synthase [Thermoanaerobaculaceae bacterium]|nr:pseudouridine synthase [Thermoanaerobaculaceae bacterium]HPS79673.1 pseudouridine synthase [Thermoanaerobaculaceae bacterium]
MTRRTPLVLAFHKPRGILVSRVREGHAPTLFEILPERYRGWFAVGRLDLDSEGLVLLCDDSRAAQRLMDPGGVAKTYLVTVEGFPSEEALARLRDGALELGSRVTRPIGITRLGKAPRGGTRLEIVLHEGINRQIRRSFHLIGHRVRRLIRMAVGTIRLGDLAPGDGRELEPGEVASLMAAAACGQVTARTRRAVPATHPDPRGR